MKRSPLVKGIMVTAIPFYVIGGFFLGMYFGDRFGNRPVGVIVGLLLGVVLAAYDVYAALPWQNIRKKGEGN